MAAARKLLVFALAALLVCSMMSTSEATKTIDYSPLEKGHKKHDPPKAGPGEANPYNRGCSPNQRCRS
ncbi:hypothetical protein DCAR_0933800 [Daucus carota subsp. sativus]|uniref:Uncharacterized protein n=1 Tax=Daucus carota subsp. sativus TaxID=79200 RepID=A0AAF0XXG8_DAUCS|nr:hypothetical protein DCAR_0933800 [Daucus carota subsp. sativus]